MAAMNPPIVLHYRGRAESFLHSVKHLAELDAEEHGPSIGLLSVHGCVALADAILVALEGSRIITDNHAEAARRLRAWCSAKQLPDKGIKHLDWLLGRKKLFSYDDQTVRPEELDLARTKMEQFFAWGLRTFPDVAQLS